MWLLTVFAVYRDFELVTKVWDIFVVEDYSIVYKVGLAILKCNKELIMTMGIDEILDLLNVRILRLDSEKVIKCALDMPALSEAYELY
jgi:hypothetical protein